MDRGRETRDRIRALIVQYPGLHLREVARQLGISLALVQYHVPGLVEDGRLDLVEEKGIARLYPPRETDREALATLRDARRLQITLVLLNQGPQRHADLVAATGFGKSTLSFHLRRLEQQGLVEKQDGAYALADPEATRTLLERHRPTPDMVDKFARLWGDLYG